MKLETFGVMVDMSRNAVMTVDALKRLMDALSKMGYNMLMLYTEDTYEVEGAPFFGYLRGKYTKAELCEIDAYGASLGIEVIPCIQTLAHMTAQVRWHKIPFDAEDIMLVGDERTYDLIDRMFATFAECLHTRRIHIGMDEARLLGKGRYLDKNGYEDPHAILQKHLARVKEIAAKYGYETMVWSDMFFCPWNNGSYYIPKREVPKEYKNALLPGVIPVYWDYYHTDEATYDDMMYNHRQLSEDFWFAGAVWTGNGYMPHVDFSIRTMIPAFRMAEKYGVKNVFLTMWGDGGGECSRFALLSALFHLAEEAKGNTDEADIKRKFRDTFGAEYDDFMLLDLDALDDLGNGAHPYSNVSKYALLSDTFNGWLDYTFSAGVAERYADAAKKLKAAEKRNPDYASVFRGAAALASALAVKYDLGVRVRSAYRSGDKDTLGVLAREVYPLAARRVRAFAKTLEEQWLGENKPAGLDMQHIRFGGVLSRLDYCRRTLLAYLAGEVTAIPELEEEILDRGPKWTTDIPRSAFEIMSPSVAK